MALLQSQYIEKIVAEIDKIEDKGDIQEACGPMEDKSDDSRSIMMERVRGVVEATNREHK
jgi:hypothetical protein